ncbi:MogA/MoaB family molybdenum cofactor biosynthesis protein [Halanaeroarchaeum sulfurireducens]|uniref:Molybdenum cofactor biosynthesis protein MoaB n=1 Tax=Halanaeroarchaeum sulfurireducens TaxID=1604004 RepID=A0A0F7PCB5_9EURY|nr:molybdenum cofactor biosynthesis protein B [Halanaeroarchaeum sulfurireducens]AKH98357.1 molybdenum cofactor biosynthesis protein MoaB [Halanaeroarchaeum sulfurireducens]
MADDQPHGATTPGDEEDASDDSSPETDATQHDHHAHDKTELGVGIVTVTSSRSLDADPSGDAIESALSGAGHGVVTRELVRDSRDVIQSVVDNLVGRSDVDLVVTTGGTGVSPDDVTVEAVGPLFEKDLPGFGEVFRSLSYEEIGTKVVGTRTTAGIANGVPVFALPGSENAVTLATEEIILPEASHLAGLATRGREEDEH